MTRNRVLLPAPLGPRTNTISARSMVRSTRTMAGTAPKTRVTPVSTTAGVSTGGSVVGRPSASTLVPREPTRPQGYRSPLPKEPASARSVWPGTSPGPRGGGICGSSRGDGKLTPLAWDVAAEIVSDPIPPAIPGGTGAAAARVDRMPVRRPARRHGTGPEDRQPVSPDVLHRHRRGGAGLRLDPVVHRPVPAQERRP